MEYEGLTHFLVGMMVLRLIRVVVVVIVVVVMTPPMVSIPRDS